MALTKVIGAGIGSVSGVNLSSGNVTVVDGQGFYFGDGSYRIEGKDDGATTARIGFVAGGSEVARFTSSGLTFGGDTAAANALDDYEEGTWTPTYRVNTGTHPTVTYNTDSTVGVYVKIGVFVHIQGRIRTNATSGGSGNLALGGLPFTNTSGSNYYSTANIGFTNQWAADNFPVSGYIAPNNQEILLLKGRSSDHRDGKGLVISVDNLTNGTNQNDIIFSATYRTA